jgi:ADP-ribose pyrophosphatase YjhB (NUDIX family)
MKQNLKNNGSRGNRIAGRLAAEKKKTVIAVCLIAVMILMWVRLLVKKGPQNAVASETAEETAVQTNPELKISFIELPKVTGRNDALTKDFFTVSNWQDFAAGREGNSGGIKEVSVVPRDGSEETISRVAGKLRLEAIVEGENPRAFINDKLLSVGDKLFIGDGINTYECEVVKIEETKVVIRCGQAEVTLRLTQTLINN